MNKKKILSLALVVCVAAILAIGGTLAYFTDTDNATNTFTMGNVKIELEENFDEEKAVLVPGSQTTNAVTKEVSIKNIGTEQAYVWYEWLIPADLDSTDGSTGTHNFVHVNSYGGTWDKYWQNPSYKIEGITSEDQTWDHTKYGTEGFIGTEKIDDVTYNKYVVLYHGILEPEVETSKAMKQVYLDSHVDYIEEDGVGYYVWSDRSVDPTKIKAEDIASFNIIVRAYGIQADGFADVYAAYEAYLAQNA